MLNITAEEMKSNEKRLEIMNIAVEGKERKRNDENYSRGKEK